MYWLLAYTKPRKERLDEVRPRRKIGNYGALSVEVCGDEADGLKKISQ